MGQRRSEGGFTLIELLVVISIIATLASIIFPTFSKAREKAREIQCASNLSQIGKALMMYMQDYDGTFLLYGYTKGGGEWSPYQFGSAVFDLQPYVKDWRIFRCPTFPEQGPLPPDYQEEEPSDPIQVFRVTSGNKEKEYRSDYSLNLGGYPKGKVLDLVATYSSNCALMADYPSCPTGTSVRHTGGIVILFADGHVKRYSFEKARPSAMFGDPLDRTRDWYQWGWDATRGLYDEWPDIP
jgi:prepilin-type N-terminal cleavage/methylation domain-containing protein/prepilin-type processing-associated H-X9-DG protein